MNKNSHNYEGTCDSIVSKNVNKNSTYSFEFRINQLKEFKEKHGHVNVSKDDDKSLHSWCSNIRSTCLRKVKGRYGITLKNMQVLKDIGFEFRPIVSSSDDSNRFSQINKPNKPIVHSLRLKKRTTSNEDIHHGQAKKLLHDLGFEHPASVASNEPVKAKISKHRIVNIRKKHAKNGSGRVHRPSSPAFDISRYTYAELLQQVRENTEMCVRMDSQPKVSYKKSLAEVEKEMFQSDEEKKEYECKFCGLGFDFQCVCIIHMAKCNPNRFGSYKPKIEDG